MLYVESGSPFKTVSMFKIDLGIANLYPGQLQLFPGLDRERSKYQRFASERPDRILTVNMDMASKQSAHQNLKPGSRGSRHAVASNFQNKMRNQMFFSRRAHVARVFGRVLGKTAFGTS